MKLPINILHSMFSTVIIWNNLTPIPQIDINPFNVTAVSLLGQYHTKNTQYNKSQNVGMEVPLTSKSDLDFDQQTRKVIVEMLLLPSLACSRKVIRFSC